MGGGAHRRTTLAAVGALVLVGLLSLGPAAQAAPPFGQASFSVPTQFPSYRPNAHDYVVKCGDGRVTVQGHTSGPWEMSIAGRGFRSGDFSQVVSLRSGGAFTVTVRRQGTAPSNYHVRCIPPNFPNFTFTRSGPVSPKYFSVGSKFLKYTIVFDSNGAPIWWYRAPAQGTRVLENGNLLWINHAFTPPRWETRRIDGSRIRFLNAVGQKADTHDLQFLDNGDYLLGAYVKQSHVDTSAFGGSSDATVVNAELQQVHNRTNLAWDWKSQDHIALAETGHRWPYAAGHGYDIVHWNSIEPAGDDAVIASFRNVDAVYKIEQSTGDIVWKLGGTTTPRSLTVQNDLYASTFGGQHDARLLPDGTVTVFDNRSNVTPAKPRAVRFDVDEQDGTATLMQSISDPDVRRSDCCGSARRLANGDWLIDWGGNNPIGGYRPNGQRTFLLTLTGTYSYRAVPVPDDGLKAADFREGMRLMARAQRAGP